MTDFIKLRTIEKFIDDYNGSCENFFNVFYWSEMWDNMVNDQLRHIRESKYLGYSS